MSTITTYDGQFLIAKQNEKGTAATTGFHKFRRVDGRIQVAKEVANAPVIDGDAWGTQDFDYTKSLSGTGSISLQLTTEGAARLLNWTLGGSDTVAEAEAAPYTHTIIPGNGLTYLTVIDSLGGADLLDARQWVDVVVTQLEITSSHDGGVVTAKLDLAAIDHTVITSVPTADTEDGEPLLHTQSAGAVNVAGLSACPSVEQFVLTIDTNAEMLYGDDITPYIAHRKRGAVSWSATVACDDETISALNEHLYGTATPANGASPSTSIFVAGFNPTLTQSEASSLELDLPACRVIVDALPDPSASGDKSTLAIAGVLRKPNEGEALTVTAVTADGTAY